MSNLKKYLIYCCLFFPYPPITVLSQIMAQSNGYPHSLISNKHLVIKLYLPDEVKDYYRATRIDWSGIIYNLEFQGHQYFGEWKTTRNPYVHEDTTGSAESVGNPELGYKESDPGEGFIRIVVGILEKILEPE
jgi:hypothetical protein